MAAPIDLRNDFEASHCGASRRGPGTRPRAVVCWRWPRSRWWQQDGCVADRRRRSADHSRLGAALQRPRTGRAGRWEVTGRTLEAQRRSPPRPLAEVVEAGPVPAVDGVGAGPQGPGAVALGDVRHLARRDHGRARVEGAGFAKISARPRHYAQNELAVEAFKKNFPAELAKIRARLPKGVEIELWWQDEARIGQKNKLADGPDVARARGRPATSAPNGPISSARSVPRRGRAPGWSCTPTPWRPPHRDQCRRRSRRPAVLIVESGRLALDAQAGDPRQHHRPGAAATIARVEPGGECLAIHARQLVVEPDRKSYEDIVALCCPASNPHRPTMEDHVPRHAQMGAWVRSMTVGIIGITFPKILRRTRGGLAPLAHLATRETRRNPKE